MITAQKVYVLLENESLWQTATLCHKLLTAANIPHAVMGAVAVCMHGYQRNTTGLDLLIRREDVNAVGETLETNGSAWVGCVQFWFAGDRAGSDSEVTLPDPADKKAIIEIEDLPVLTLAKLIEVKIACGLGSLRRTYKDFRGRDRTNRAVPPQ